MVRCYDKHAPEDTKVDMKKAYQAKLALHEICENSICLNQITYRSLTKYIDGYYCRNILACNDGSYEEEHVEECECCKYCMKYLKDRRSNFIKSKK